MSHPFVGAKSGGNVEFTGSQFHERLLGEFGEAQGLRRGDAPELLYG